MRHTLCANLRTWLPSDNIKSGSIKKSGQAENRTAKMSRAITAREVASVEAREDRHGTIGAVAIDMAGHLAAATSTGGITNKYPGRVGDTPLVGCGFYADDNPAVSCTGDGEDFVRLLIAKRAADFVAHGETARDAATATIALLGAKATGTGGLIIVDRKGNIGFAWNSQHMKYAYITEDMEGPVSGF